MNRKVTVDLIMICHISIHSFLILQALEDAILLSVVMIILRDASMNASTSSSVTFARRCAALVKHKHERNESNLRTS